jgi:UDPglucose 6-dehydrogenase
VRSAGGAAERAACYPVAVDAPRRRVAVIGAGYVGLATAMGLVEGGHSVELIETRPDRLAALRDGRSPIHEAGLPKALAGAFERRALRVSETLAEDAEVILVCVGTPIGAEGRSDLTQLRGALTGLAGPVGRGVPIVIRSTVPPGATRLTAASTGTPTSHLFTNPEFLRQGTALADVAAPTRIVIGRFPDADATALGCVVGLYDRLTVPVLIVDVEAAELIKNGANAFLALKLSFTNEMAALAEEYGTDIGEVLQGMGLDPRIGFDYMRPGYGFGGSCLPKELQALAVAGQDRALPMHVTIAAAAANGAQQRRFADRIERILGGFAGRRVGLLGLAFKAGTDDVRESPALALAARLLADGADVRAYDPEAAANAVAQLPGLVTVETPADAIRGADAVVIATEWPSFLDLDWATLKSTMGAPLVIDGRRLLDAEHMRILGYRYVAVGTASEDPSPVTS